MTKKTTPDVIVTGKQIETLVNKVIKDGFKKGKGPSQKEIEYYNKLVYRDVKDRIKELIETEYNDKQIRNIILEVLLEDYSWDELVELGIK